MGYTKVSGTAQGLPKTEDAQNNAELGTSAPETSQDRHMF